MRGGSFLSLKGSGEYMHLYLWWAGLRYSKGLAYGVCLGSLGSNHVLIPGSIVVSEGHFHSLAQLPAD